MMGPETQTLPRVGRAGIKNQGGRSRPEYHKEVR
jgi:hypothetical protein